MPSRKDFLASAAAAGLALPRAARAASARSLTGGYVPSTLFAPVFVAKDRGYFDAAGLTVSLTPIVAGQDALALLAAGRIEFIAGGLSAAFFNGIQRGLDVRIVASTGYQPRSGAHPSALVVRADLSEVRRVADLRGKRVAWNGGAGAASAYYVARIFAKSGLKLGDVEAINIGVPDQGVAFERKAIDAAFTSTPTTEAFEERKLARFLAAPPAGIAATGIFFGPSVLAAPDVARALLDACRRGAADIAGAGYDNPQNLATFATYTQQPVDVLKRSARYDFAPDLRIDQPTLEDMQRVFLGLGILTYATPLDAARMVARF